ncbi:MAG: carboxymuconolactone decarboxylase family protein [Candidatus Thorarchaeota archaeon]
MIRQINNKEKEEMTKKITKRDLLRSKEPRIPPLNEVEYVQGLISSKKAINSIKYEEQDDKELDWNKAVLSIVKEMKGSTSYYLDPISAYLKLEEKGIDVNSIDIKGHEASVKDYIKQKETIFNLRATLMRHKDLFLRWGVFANQVFVRSEIPPREKELIISRTAWLCQSEYEWQHHIAGSKQAGLFSDELIDRIKEGPDAEGWDPFDAILVRTVDELYTNNYISDTTWKIISQRYKTNQLIEILFIVGYYNLLALVLNSLGVQLEGMYRTDSE